MKYLSCVLPFFFLNLLLTSPKYLCTVHHLIFPGWRCTRRLMERCASTRNPSTPRRRSSTTRGSSTTWRWERAAWVGGGRARRRGRDWGAAVAYLCLFWILCTSGEVDQRLKVVGGTSPALHWMNIWLKKKKLPFNSPQRLLCFKASGRSVGGGVWEEAKRSMQLPVTATLFLFSFFFFDPSSHVYSPPPFHLWVFVPRLLPRSSKRRHSADKHLFMSSLVAHRAFVFQPCLYRASGGALCRKGFSFLLS